MNFWDIVKESEATRHEVYGLAVQVKGKKGKMVEKVLRAPSPVKTVDEVSEELQALRNEERRERASRLVELVNRIGLDQCEAVNANIASLLPPPVHVQEIDAELPVTLNLIAN